MLRILLPIYGETSQKWYVSYLIFSETKICINNGIFTIFLPVINIANNWIQSTDTNKYCIENLNVLEWIVNLILIFRYLKPRCLLKIHFVLKLACPSMYNSGLYDRLISILQAIYLNLLYTLSQQKRRNLWRKIRKRRERWNRKHVLYWSGYTENTT